MGGGFGYVNALKRFIASYPDRVTVLTDTTAKKLVKDASGRVVGVEAEHDGKKLVVNAAKGVVITTGGFAANVELRQKVNTGVWKELVLDAKIPSTNNFKASQGEGLKLAEDAGAALINLSDIQLHPGGAPKTGIMSSWPSGRNRIFLNNAGERWRPSRGSRLRKLWTTSLGAPFCSSRSSGGARGCSTSRKKSVDAMSAGRLREAAAGKTANGRLRLTKLLSRPGWPERPRRKRGLNDSSVPAPPAVTGGIGGFSP